MEVFRKYKDLYTNLYYTSPLLVRSIFLDALKYFISLGEKNEALQLVRTLKNMKPEYEFGKIFSEYENKILETITPKNHSG